MSRKLPEWEATNDNQAIPARVKIRVFDRAGGKCANCTLTICASLRPSYDHIQALINGGKHAESNLQLLCVPCHVVKTSGDVAEKSVTARIRAKHLGIKKPRKITRWRRFDGSIREASRDRS